MASSLSGPVCWTSTIDDTLYILITVLKMFSRTQFFTKTEGCIKFFSQPVAGLTNQGHVWDYQAGAPLTHTWLQQLVHQFIQQSNGSTYTHLTDAFTTQHIGTPDQVLADSPKPNLGPRPNWYSKYHGKFTKFSATSQLQLCLSLLLDTYLPCSLIQYLFIIFTLCHSTFYLYLYISFSGIGSPSFLLWIPC